MSFETSQLGGIVEDHSIAEILLLGVAAIIVGLVVYLPDGGYTEPMMLTSLALLAGLRMYSAGDLYRERSERVGRGSSLW